MTSNNMYRVGDFVYFEVSASAPYQIRKIEELNKTSTGAVEAKVVCFYRRRDLSLNLIELADKHQGELDPIACSPESAEKLSLSTDLSQRDALRQIRHRELFLSRQLETLPATHIRGKCTVTLHSDTEPSSIYLSKDDAFFFQFVYDPLQKTLQADRGTIREGPEYQADVPPFDPDKRNTCYDDQQSWEELRWNPNQAPSESEINSYLLLARSLGTLGRAYYPTASLRQPNLSMSVACAARDITHQLALDTLHAADYHVVGALSQLCPNGQPAVRLDEMESWSVSEGNLFEEALEKYGKCFYDIQSDFLPWKQPKNLIEFYYMWKTTDHYIQQKRMKAAEAEHHLKQVYIPNYNKPNPAVLYPGPENPHAACEACPNSSSPQWFALGPSNSPLRVCADCWTYWKRYGDLKAASILAGPLRSTNGRISGVLRDGIGFYFLATPLLRVLRRLHPRSEASSRQQARRPFRPGSSVPCWQADARLHASSLPVTAIRQFIDRLHTAAAARRMRGGGPASSEEPHEQRAQLEKLLDRIFPNSRSALPTELNGILPRRPDCDEDSDPVAKTTTSTIPPITDSGNTTSSDTLSISPPAAVNGRPPPATTGPALDRKRPPATATDCSQEQPTDPNPCPPKRAHLSDVTSKAADLKLVTIAGPRRRVGMGPGEGGPNTLMFLATDHTKLVRRKHQTVIELRRLGRRPCAVVFYSPADSQSAAVTQSSVQPESSTDLGCLKTATPQPGAPIVVNNNNNSNDSSTHLRSS